MPKRWYSPDSPEIKEKFLELLRRTEPKWACMMVGIHWGTFNQWRKKAEETLLSMGNIGDVDQYQSNRYVDWYLDVAEAMGIRLSSLYDEVKSNVDAKGVRNLFELLKHADKETYSPPQPINDQQKLQYYGNGVRRIENGEENDEIDVKSLILLLSDKHVQKLILSDPAAEPLLRDFGRFAQLADQTGKDKKPPGKGSDTDLGSAAEAAGNVRRNGNTQ